MAHITYKGELIETLGTLPVVGSKAPAFALRGPGETTVTQNDFLGSKVLLHIVPALPTRVCLLSAKRFHKEVTARPGAVLLTVSSDPAGEQEKICASEGLNRSLTLSSEGTDFGKDYQVEITTGHLAGRLSRAVVVIDDQGNISHTEHVPEIAQEPDYDAALAALD